MNRCIYCLKCEPEVTFIGTEHVLPQAFGLFRDNPTLNGCVCDGCNAAFSRELDLPLARDTPEGLLRFRFGIRDPSDYKHAGRRASMTSNVVTGRWAGATLWYKDYDGVLVPFHAPQVGFGTQSDGPFTWFPRDKLPTKEELRSIYGTGGGAVEFVGIGDSEDNLGAVSEVITELRAIGANFDGPIRKTSDVGVQPNAERIESVAKLGLSFFRCISKICLNYLAFVCSHDLDHIYGRAFDPIRLLIVNGTEDERLQQWVAKGPSDPVRSRGDAYLIGFRRQDGCLRGRVRLLSGSTYAVQLNVDADGIPQSSAAHEYDLDSMVARPRYPWAY